MPPVLPSLPETVYAVAPDDEYREQLLRFRAGECALSRLEGFETQQVFAVFHPDIYEPGEIAGHLMMNGVTLEPLHGEYFGDADTYDEMRGGPIFEGDDEPETEAPVEIYKRPGAFESLRAASHLLFPPLLPHGHSAFIVHTRNHNGDRSVVMTLGINKPSSTDLRRVVYDYMPDTQDYTFEVLSPQDYSSLMHSMNMRHLLDGMTALALTREEFRQSDHL